MSLYVMAVCGRNGHRLLLELGEDYTIKSGIRERHVRTEQCRGVQRSADAILGAMASAASSGSRQANLWLSVPRDIIIHK